jgi:hypothetical protein
MDFATLAGPAIALRLGVISPLHRFYVAAQFQSRNRHSIQSP